MQCLNTLSPKTFTISCFQIGFSHKDKESIDDVPSTYFFKKKITVKTMSWIFIIAMFEFIITKDTIWLLSNKALHGLDEAKLKKHDLFFDLRDMAFNWMHVDLKDTTCFLSITCFTWSWRGQSIKKLLIFVLHCYGFLIKYLVN